MKKPNRVQVGLKGGNYPFLYDDNIMHPLVQVPWQGDRDATIALANKLTAHYNEHGWIEGPAPLKVPMCMSGYTYKKRMPEGHVLQNEAGGLSLWFANLNHANQGIIWKNTHLEFARNFTLDEV